MTRIASLVLALLLQQPANVNVAGEWAAQLALPLGDTNFTMFLNQKGTELSGYILNESGQFDLKGSVSKDQVKFQWDYPDGGKILTITFNGKLEGRALSGVAKVGNVGEGMMYAQRK